jgi:hypothetical protein
MMMMIVRCACLISSYAQGSEEDGYRKGVSELCVYVYMCALVCCLLHLLCDHFMCHGKGRHFTTAI